MKKLLLIGTLFGAFAVAGCSSPCDELQKKCDACKDSTQKASCSDTVRTYRSLPTSETSCQALLDTHTYDNCETN